MQQPQSKRAFLKKAVSDRDLRRLFLVAVLAFVFLTALVAALLVATVLLVPGLYGFLGLTLTALLVATLAACFAGYHTFGALISGARRAWRDRQAYALAAEAASKAGS